MSESSTPPPGVCSLNERYPHRATSWRLRSRQLKFGRTPLLMGILNVTPDSFSDGGRFFELNRAVEQGLQMVEEGADILDVGGESTRPYADPVEEAEELRRVDDVIAKLAAATETPISIDTSKAAVAEIAVERGAEIINDVTGLEKDPRMPEVALASEAGVCVMHMQGTPQTMQDDPSYADVVEDIFSYLAARLESLKLLGFPSDQICVDPGIGFGKTHQHNLTLAACCGRYHALGAPLLVGHSRKGFIAKTLGDKEAERTFATVGASLALATQGVQILRVHDVRANREALELFAACGGIDGQELKLS